MSEQNFSEPYYSVYTSIYCTGTILVNDVPVDSWHGIDTKGEEGYSSDAAINHVILQSGKYKVVGKMYPRYGSKKLTEKDVLGMEFYCRNKVQPKETRFSFHPKLESPDNVLKDGKVVNPAFQGLPYFEIATEIEIKLPFVLDGWQNSVPLDKMDKEDLKSRVLAYFRQIHAVLKEHNASKFLEISKEKEELQAKAFYFDSTRKQEVRQSIAKLFSENLEVLPLDEAELKLQLWGYGKLVTLLRSDGSSALQFKTKDAEKQGNVELDVKLHLRDINGKFSII